MPKLLALFNIVTGAASVAGLWVSLDRDQTPMAIAVMFVITMVLAAYVLFVPANLITENVAAKFTLFRNKATGDELLLQRGTVAIKEVVRCRYSFIVHSPRPRG
jgi:hypothetical protein